jgi:hypothetical protein
VLALVDRLERHQLLRERENLTLVHRLGEQFAEEAVHHRTGTLNLTAEHSVGGVVAFSALVHQVQHGEAVHEEVVHHRGCDGISRSIHLQAGEGVGDVYTPRGGFREGDEGVHTGRRCRENGKHS